MIPKPNTINEKHTQFYILRRSDFAIDIEGRDALYSSLYESMSVRDEMLAFRRFLHSFHAMRTMRVRGSVTRG